MTEWREATIAELCARTTSGGTPSRKRPDFFCGPSDGVPWVKSQELTDRRIAACPEHITVAGLKGSSAKIVPAGSVLVAMYGATVGKLGYLDIEATTNQAICVLITDPETTDSRFLYYALMQARGDLIAHAQGAAQQNLSQAVIREFTLRVPALPEQRVIGSLLTSIDDLIDNNRRRIGLLEQIAQAIYWEWFVYFRYPGHEDATLVDSPLGPIPDGWEVKPLVAVADLTMGQSPKSEHYNTDGLGEPFHQGVKEFGPHFPTHRTFCTIDGRRAMAGDILISVRAPVGRLNIAPDDMIIGRGLAAARSREGRQALLYRSLKDVVFAEEDSMGGGTIFNAVGRKELDNLDVLCASTELEDRANELFVTNLSLVRDLTVSNQRLTGIRDLLLPRLVTGQIEVSELDLDAVVGSVA